MKKGREWLHYRFIHAAHNGGADFNIYFSFFFFSFFSRLLCRLLSGAALHFFFMEALLLIGRSGLFFYSKRWRHFFECAPRLPSRFTWAGHFLIYCHFSFVSTKFRFNWIEMFQNQMLEIYVIKVNFRIWLFNWI